MSSHHDHATHDHHHGGVAHEPSADWRVAYRKAYEAAQPDPGRRVVAVDLEARAIDWTFAPGAPVRAWGYNGQIPGPTLEGRVGDVLGVRFTNRLEQSTGAPSDPELVKKLAVDLYLTRSECRGLKTTSCALSG